MEKQFTVVIATYNAAATVERALCSVINQKADNVELVVVDGASTDETLHIINIYKDNIDTLISEPDNGVYDAWNKALKHCHGQWIMFLGADDYYVDGIFDRYAAFLADKDLSGIDIVSARCQLIDKAGKKLRVIGGAYSWEVFRNKIGLSHASVLHNRKLFEEVGEFDIRFNINADYELLLRKRLKALFMDEIVVFMQIGGISYSSAGLFQTFKVKQYRKSNILFWNIYYLLKGLTGFYLRKLWLIV